MNDLEKLNRLKVVDFDADSDKTMIYVHVENTKEAREILKELGATSDDFADMIYGLGEENLLDICNFGFNRLGAGHWTKGRGFIYE